MSDDARQLIFRVHAVQRMFERGLTANDVSAALAAGETIEDYPKDTPYPSRLVLGWVGGRPLHVVAAENASAREIIVVTVYEPDPIRWDSDFKRRRP